MGTSPATVWNCVLSYVVPLRCELFCDVQHMWYSSASWRDSFGGRCLCLLSELTRRPLAEVVQVPFRLREWRVIRQLVARVINEMIYLLPGMADVHLRKSKKALLEELEQIRYLIMVRLDAVAVVRVVDGFECMCNIPDDCMVAVVAGLRCLVLDFTMVTYFALCGYKNSLRFFERTIKKRYQQNASLLCLGRFVADLNIMTNGSQLVALVGDIKGKFWELMLYEMQFVESHPYHWFPRAAFANVLVMW